jgi:RimJ/RimL family protein N-acetyltransferase
MEQLQPDDYPAVAGIVQNTRHELSIASVIAGINPGEIFVDHVQAPKSTLIKTPECIVVAGDATNNEFNRAVRDQIDFFEPIQCDSDEWVLHLQEFHPNVFLKAYKRMHYQLHEMRYVDYQKDLHPQASLARIDHALLEQRNLKNHQNVLDWILRNWRTIEHFETYGLGMCIRNQTDIISWCLMDCRLGEQAEIGIQTDPAYRRQGFGAITVAATVAACLTQGIHTIGWHCVATNIGSRKVAEKVGFRHCVDYIAYTPFPPIENETDLTPAQWEEWAVYYENANRVQPRFSRIIAECWAKAQKH